MHDKLHFNLGSYSLREITKTTQSKNAFLVLDQVSSVSNCTTPQPPPAAISTTRIDTTETEDKKQSAPEEIEHSIPPVRSSLPVDTRKV